MITLSDDSYVRLTLVTLKGTALTHLVSGLDDDDPVTAQQGAVISHISGYTEWVSHTTPTISVGWDWQIDVSRGRPLCVRISPPRSNLMLVDYQQRDLGPLVTVMVLGQAIDEMGWQNETLNAINTRYR